jgi:hypothetical protein
MFAATVPEGVPDDAAENIRDEVLTLYRKDILSVFNPVVRACEDHVRGSLKAMKEMPHAKQVCLHSAMPKGKYLHETSITAAFQPSFLSVVWAIRPFFEEASQKFPR